MTYLAVRALLLFSSHYTFDMPQTNSRRLQYADDLCLLYNELNKRYSEKAMFAEFSILHIIDLLEFKKEKKEKKIVLPQ